MDIVHHPPILLVEDPFLLLSHLHLGLSSGLPSNPDTFSGAIVGSLSSVL